MGLPKKHTEEEEGIPNSLRLFEQGSPNSLRLFEHGSPNSLRLFEEGIPKNCVSLVTSILFCQPGGYTFNFVLRYKLKN